MPLAETSPDTMALMTALLPILEQVTGATLDQIISKSNDSATVGARYALMAALQHFGVRPASIARLVHRSHATVAHGLFRAGVTMAKPSTKYSATHQQEYVTTETIQGIVAILVDRVHWSADSTRAVDHGAFERLYETLPPAVAPAVGAYLEGNVLGRKRISGVQGAYGLRLLADDQAVRRQVLDALRLADLEQYGPLIEVQARRCNFPWRGASIERRVS